MESLFNSGISIEKMAAFLDGNLSSSDMLHISSMIERNDSLKEFIELSDRIEDNLIDASSETFGLPLDIQSPEFLLPDISGEDYSNEHTQFDFHDHFDDFQQYNSIEDVFSQEPSESFIDNEYLDDNQTNIDNFDDIQSQDELDNLV